jgi:3-oxoacyl-[acyl-carrier-protein] synthase-3
VPDVYVDGFVYALGETKTHVTDSEAAGRLFSPAADLLSAGFEWHHLCEDGTTSYDLAKAATAQLPGELLRDADAIVYATCLPLNGSATDPGAWRESRDVRHLMDYPASRLQADFGLDRAAAVGLNQQGCTSMLGALRIARALLATEPGWQRVLCVTADRFPAGAIYEQSYNLISDGAAACVVTRQPAAFRLLASHHITNGGLVDASSDETVGTYFSYLQLLIRETFERSGLTAADLAWVVPQNTNDKAWQILARLIGVDYGRVWQPALPETGHVISADNVINLAALTASGQLQPGDKLLLLMAGHGLNWQSTVLEATEAFA